MRIGEVLACSIDDLIENKTKIHIHNTLTKDKNVKIISGEHTKTYNKKTCIDEGERYFTIDTELDEIIKRQLERVGALITTPT